MTSSPALVAAAAQSPGGPADALAQLQQLNADLLRQDSATATLQRWCEAHGSPPELKIAAVRVGRQDKAARPEDRDALGVGADEVLRYRRVRLICGDRVLSEADNWYRPSVLTPEMNKALEESETPFGVVVRSLGYSRATLGAEMLFQTEDGGAIPAEVMRHRAVLSTPDGTPFSLVVETYTNQVLFGA